MGVHCYFYPKRSLPTLDDSDDDFETLKNNDFIYLKTNFIMYL